MNHHLAAILAVERQRDLERQAECCAEAAYHRRAVVRTLRERLAEYRGRFRDRQD